jgi:DNA-binding SARP family transcriptional activator
MQGRWRIELFGGLRVEGADRVITRFQTQRTGVLLAYLAYHLPAHHPRETLIELLWPECEPTAGRARLSTALSSLRRQLEPPGFPAGHVIIANRSSVRLNPAAIATDVAEFQAGLDAAARTRSGVQRAQLLADTVERYSGSLLSGYNENWVLEEQRRLAESPSGGGRRSRTGSGLRPSGGRHGSPPRGGPPRSDSTPRGDGPACRGASPV